MGAKLSEVPIEDFSSVAGTWKGMVSWKGYTSWTSPITITLRQDGSYDEDNGWLPGQGKMRIVEGKLQYESADGLVVTVTLHEGNGKRILKGKSQDAGRAFKVKPAKKKRNKKKKKKNQTSEKKEY